MERLFHWERGRRFERIERAAQRKFVMLDAAKELRDLAAAPGNRPEELSGIRKGQYSIPINDPWRLCFEWRDGDAMNAEIVDYH